MLKIKDNVDLKELEKFGFRYDVLDDTYNRSVERKTDEVCIVVSQYDRSICLMCIQDYGMDGDEYFRYDVDEYVQDLIKADLVEKVEEW